MTPLHEAALTLVLRGWQVRLDSDGVLKADTGDISASLHLSDGVVVTEVAECAESESDGLAWHAIGQSWHHGLRQALVYLGHPIDSLAGLDGLPERLRSAREAAGLSRRSAALGACVPYMTWCRAESLRRSPRPSTVAKLEAWLDGRSTGDGEWHGPALSDMLPEWVEAATTLLDGGWVLAISGSDHTLRARYGSLPVAVVPLNGWSLVKAGKYYPMPDGWVGGYTWHSAVRKALRQLGPEGAEAMASLGGYRDIGDRIKANRLRLGMSRVQAAKDAGVGSWSWGSWEDGFFQPTARHRALCEAWLKKGHTDAP